jgi:dTDP-4-dehydrorhamnose reductase
MKKLLVTGASGFLGWNICRDARKEWSIFGTVFSNPVEIAGVNIIKIDLTDYKAFKILFNKIRPDAVIHTAAAANPNYCQDNREDAHTINVEATINIAGLCCDCNIPLAFTSTDLVFDGLNAPYKEDDPVSPVNVYGEQKVMAEEGVIKTYPSAAVCRMPLMFGKSETSPVFFQTMVAALKEGEELRLFVDEYRTPVSGKDAAEGLFLALKEVHGLIHLGGRERISRYNFGLLVMDVLGVSEARLERCRQAEMIMAAPRPADISLDSSKAFALGFNPLTLREEVRRLIKEEIL